MPFEKFSQFGKKESSFISLTISKSFGFGGDWLKANNLANKKYVELFYDKLARKVGFSFSVEKKDKSGAFKLIENKGTDSKSVVARSFFSTYLHDIDISKLKSKYLPEKINDPNFGELYSIKLEEK